MNVQPGRRGDPAWFAPAQALYGLCLRLHPRHIRDAHGEEMRHVFRDRCRDVAAGRASAWRLIGHDALADSLWSGIGAHMNLGIGPPRRRHGVMAIALLCTALLLVFQDPLTMAGIQAWKKAKSSLVQAYYDRYRQRQEAAVRELSRSLLARPAPEDRALGAWLLAVNNRFDWRPGLEQTSTANRERLEQDMASAKATALSLADSVDVSILAAVAVTCTPRIDCDNAPTLQRLAVVDRANALWPATQFVAANTSGDDAAMAALLARSASSARYDNPWLALRRRALREAIALHPADDTFIARVARHVSHSRGIWHDEYKFRLSRYCAPYSRYPDGNLARIDEVAHFEDRHPEQREACAGFATLLWASQDPEARDQGAGLLRALDVPGAPSDVESRQSWQRWSDASKPEGEFVCREPVYICSLSRFGLRDYSEGAWAAWARRTAGAGPDGP